MFQTGDLIIYANTGVCEVTSVGALDEKDKSKLYYTLSPCHGTETIFIPVDSKAFMRSIITKDEAIELINRIPEISGNVCADRNMNMLKSRYEESFSSHSCEALIGLIKGVYTKQEGIIQNGKKLGQVDARYMKRAEDLLFGELAAALGIDRSCILEYIEKVTGDKFKDVAII